MKIKASKDTDDHARAFLLEPATEVEDKLMASIKADLVRAGYVPPTDAFLEWGCVEHNLIHVFHDDGRKVIEYRPGGFIEGWTL